MTTDAGAPAPSILMTLDQHHAARASAARLADEFGDRFDAETIERVLHDSFEQLAPSSRLPHFLPLLAERFARQRLQALARVGGETRGGVPAVLFLCVQNAGRSQMALGFLHRYAGDAAIGWSGGSHPAGEVSPVAIEAMAEVGIDLTREFPKPWTDDVVRAADVVVTMGCGDTCPVFPGTRYEDWEIADPDGMSVAEARVVRDEIERRVLHLLGTLGVAIA